MSKNIKLKLTRIARDWTQQFTADKLGICLRQYQNYEYGISIPSVEMAKKISDIFEKPIDEIFFG